QTPDAAATGTEDGAAIEPDPAVRRLASLRPKLRPQSVLKAAAAAREAVEAASLAAKAAAAEKTADAAVLPVAMSRRPAARPRDFSKAVAAAVAAATRETTTTRRQVKVPDPVQEPEEADEPEVRVSAAPRIPTHANVAKQATFKNVLNLSKTNLIGIYGSDSNRYAMIRSSSGRYQKIRVGDRVDGGTVAAITRSEVRYKKGSKMLALSMPNG
ncbi:MAG: translation initiation factor 2, partial [Pseudorhodobacter sp.]|nr:translation initiation factor 2 [Pseudorhodobacter sp.]